MPWRDDRTDNEGRAVVRPFIFLKEVRANE